MHSSGEKKESDSQAEELSGDLKDTKPKGFMAVPEGSGRRSREGSHSNRAARSMSPMSDLRGSVIDNIRKESPMEAFDTHSPVLPRKLSQEEASSGGRAVQKQGSGKLHNLSEEAANGNKSALSETLSNPDLDEYFFNK